jgi:excisionase family DNA binding protein
MTVLERAFLTVAEVAAQLRVHPHTIYRSIAVGELPAARVGGVLRIDARELEKYLTREETDR